MEYGLCGDLVIIYPEPYSIYRGLELLGLRVQLSGLESTPLSLQTFDPQTLNPTPPKALNRTTTPNHGSPKGAPRKGDSGRSIDGFRVSMWATKLIVGDYIGVSKGDTTSSDCSSY